MPKRPRNPAASPATEVASAAAGTASEASAEAVAALGELWIFGYGSLVWRPGFPNTERRAARIDGWKRRFWQGSTDHRGRPGAPGRVVTLVPERTAFCWGMAYRVAQSARLDVLAALDHREKGGYARHLVALRFAHGNPDQTGAEEGMSATGLVYIATPDNPNYLGPAPPAAIATQIARSEGPSGHNREYVLNLARALRAMGAEDEHVFSIARELEKSEPR